MPLLKDLVFELKGVDWYDLGIQLNVPASDLKSIGRENPTEAMRLAEVLSYWLNNEAASWENIVEALERIGGHGNIITTVQSKYLKLPMNPGGKHLLYQVALSGDYF